MGGKDGSVSSGRKKLSHAEVVQIVKLHQNYRNGVMGGHRASFAFHTWPARYFPGKHLRADTGKLR